MKINWKVRLQHKQFWVSLIALLLVLANQTAGILMSILQFTMHKLQPFQRRF